MIKSFKETKKKLNMFGHNSEVWEGLRVIHRKIFWTIQNEKRVMKISNHHYVLLKI